MARAVPRFCTALTAPAPRRPVGVAHDAVQRDLPRPGPDHLGYYNDLLYIAAVIAPASFNDVQLSNNANSFYTSAEPTSYFNAGLGLYMVPTGQAIRLPWATTWRRPRHAQRHLAARALTAIAHEQISFSHVPICSMRTGMAVGRAAPTRACCSRRRRPTTAPPSASSSIPTPSASSARPGQLRLDRRLAEQSLHPDFDPGLTVLFDKQGQGAVMQSTSTPARALACRSISHGAGGAGEPQRPFGFADFFAGGDASMWRGRWPWPRPQTATTTRRRSCGSAGSGPTASRSLCTGSTTCRARSRGFILAIRATSRRCRRAPIDGRQRRRPVVRATATRGSNGAARQCRRPRRQSSPTTLMASPTRPSRRPTRR